MNTETFIHGQIIDNPCLDDIFANTGTGTDVIADAQKKKITQHAMNSNF